MLRREPITFPEEALYPRTALRLNVSMYYLEMRTGWPLFLHVLFNNRIQGIIQALAHKHVHDSQLARAYDNAEVGGLFLSCH